MNFITLENISIIIFSFLLVGLSFFINPFIGFYLGAALGILIFFIGGIIGGILYVRYLKDKKDSYKRNTLE